MKTAVLVPAFALALCAFSGAAAAMATVPYTGPGATTIPEPNRLTTGPKARGSANDPYAFQAPLNPYLGIMPYAAPPQSAREQSGPGFLNADPFDPNSVVNSYERNLYANPYPYDPVYNPYGQGASTYAPRGGASVPMGNGIRYGR
jgi:hypothetical protein